MYSHLQALKPQLSSSFHCAPIPPSRYCPFVVSFHPSIPKQTLPSTARTVGHIAPQSTALMSLQIHLNVKVSLSCRCISIAQLVHREMLYSSLVILPCLNKCAYLAHDLNGIHTHVHVCINSNVFVNSADMFNCPQPTSYCNFVGLMCVQHLQLKARHCGTLVFWPRTIRFPEKCKTLRLLLFGVSGFGTLHVLGSYTIKL